MAEEVMVAATARVNLKHVTLPEFKSEHQGQSVIVRKYTGKDNKVHTFFTCGSTVGAVSKKLDTDNLAGKDLQIVWAVTPDGEIPTLCAASGATVVAEL